MRIDEKRASAYTTDEIWLMLRMGQTLGGQPLTAAQFIELRKTREHRIVREKREVVQP